MDIKVLKNKNDSNLVSVIIPTYNRAQFITKSLNSVWNQTYRPIEVLIIDDGSTDKTQEVIEEWIADHNRGDFKTKFLTQKKSGAPTARNTGIKNATGRYLQFFDSDDILFPNKIALQITKMQEEKTPICICGYYHVNENGDRFNVINNNRSIENILKSDLRLSTLISVIDTTMIDNEFLRWNPKLKKYQDRDFHLKLFFIIENFSIVNEPLFEWVRHKGEGIFDSTKDSWKINWLFLKSLMIFYFNNLDKIEPYKRPFIKQLFKSLLQRIYVTSGISDNIPQSMKVWRYLRK